MKFNVLFLGLLVTMACETESRAPARSPQPYPPQPYPAPNGNTGGQPGNSSNFPQQQQPWQPSGQPPPQQNTRPLLTPLIGSPAMQEEVRGILATLVMNLQPDFQARVRGIPLVFEQKTEVNAYAGCNQSTPYMAGTEGFLQAADAIAQTNAADELFQTRTYDAYTAQVLPQIIKSESASPALPLGVIPPQYLMDARRLSRAREIFQDVVAFTFGHELAHHYLGHTGCANGQPMAPGPLGTALVLLGNAIPIWSQAYESGADSYGSVNALDSGLARRPQYRWSEKGGVLLLDFFARLERAAGASGGFFNPLNLLRSHPQPGIRIPIVQQVARDWYVRHPGVQ